MEAQRQTKMKLGWGIFFLLAIIIGLVNFEQIAD